MNKKIKVIELLNEIANGEDLPKRIKIQDYVFELSKDYEHYYYNEDVEITHLINHNFSNLNDEVEILEDNTEEIEELEKEQEAIANPKTMMQEIRFYYDSNKMGDKINEIIRYIKRKEKNND